MINKSVVNSQYPISEKQWALSLVRKPYGRNNPEHAILLLEGIQLNEQQEPQYILSRFEFVGNISHKAGNLQIALTHYKGIVLIHPYLLSTNKNPHDFFWETVMKDREMNEGCTGATWNITQAMAEQLNNNIKASQANPPDYQMSGSRGLAPKSVSQGGHNCFTWARNRIVELDRKRFEKDPALQWGFKDFTGARTSKHLERATVQSQRKCLK